MIYLSVAISTFLAASTVTHAQGTSSRTLNVHTLGADRTGVRAARTFWKLYGEDKNECWYKLSAGYLAEFEDEGIRHKLIFNKSGNWLYTMREYTEKELPRDIRHMVRSTYYDFSIGWVKEVIMNKDTAYVIHIDSPAEWKDLIVRDGEIEVQKSYERQATSH